MRSAQVRRDSGREGERTEVGNLEAHGTPLATRADQIAVTIPYMMTREAKRIAVREFLATWLQILRGNPGCGGV